MTKETFVRTVEGVLHSFLPTTNLNSVIHSKIVALGRRFEARSLTSQEAAEAIEKILPLEVNREIKHALEKSLR